MYEETGKSVYFNCLKLTQDDQAARDILQSTYLKAFEKLGSLAYPENFLAWINRIAINDCKSFFAQISNSQQLDEEFAESIPDDGLIPADYVENDAKRQIIMDIIDNNLTLSQRQTVILYYYNNMSVAEISNIMDCPEGTVLSRLNSSRKKLREAVLIYEKENNDKLHSVMPIGIIGLIFKTEEQKITLPKMNFAEFAAAKAGTCSQKTINNTAKAVKTGGKTMLSTLKGKIIAGVSALVIVGGAITAGVIISSDDDSDRRRGNDDDDDKTISVEIDEDDEDDSKSSDDDDDKDNEESEYNKEDSSIQESSESEDDESSKESDSDDNNSSDNEESEYPEFEGLEVIKLAQHTEDGEGADLISGKIVDVYNEVTSVDNSFILLDNEGNIYYYYPYSRLAYDIKTIGENTSITKFDDIAFSYNQERFVAIDGRKVYAKVISETETWNYDEPTVILEGEGTLYEDVEDLESIKISKNGFELYAMDSSGFWHAAHAYTETNYPNPVDGGLGFYHNALDTFANLEHFGIEVVDMVDTYFALSDKGQIHEVNNAAEEDIIENSEDYVFVDVFDNCTHFYYITALGLTDDNKIVALTENGTVVFEEDCPEGTLENVWMSNNLMTVKTDTGYYTAAIASRWDTEEVDTAFYPCDALNNVADKIVRITDCGNVLLSNGYLYDYTID
ncbi:MAG: sigma-70 family RNA polymerase sigma factor [Oscillospiraceae bacterium]|nr:sigma-70 family RNA polymerase sigma factor [Oscillospiraceae bacterium]